MLISIYFSDLVPKGPFSKRSFEQKVLFPKGPLDRRSFWKLSFFQKVLLTKGFIYFGGPLAKGPLEKVLCDKVLLLKVPLPQPIFDMWYNIAKKFKSLLFEDFVIYYILIQDPLWYFWINTCHLTMLHSAK